MLLISNHHDHPFEKVSSNNKCISMTFIHMYQYRAKENVFPDALLGSLKNSESEFYIGDERLCLQK